MRRSSDMRSNNEYMRALSVRKCPCCDTKMGKDEKVYSWGEYRWTYWRNITKFCQYCFKSHVRDWLTSKLAETTGSIIGYQGQQLPEWLCVETRKVA